MRRDRFCYCAKAILLGLATAQVVAVVHVYLSNLHLFNEITAVAEAGYLTVPNQRVAETLRDFGPAFFGGVFFTFSVGAGLSVFSLAVAWIWGQGLGRKKAALIPVLLLWLFAVAAVNAQGLSPMATLYFLVVPPVVFISFLGWMSHEDGKRFRIARLAHLTPLAIIAIAWTTQADGSLFVDVRDYLLLSNRAGEKVSDFYYRYTLYPAQAFKSLEQKTIRAYRMGPFTDKTVARRLQSVLLDYDYLPVASRTPVALEITEEEDILSFKCGDREILQVALKQFFDNPQSILKNFSEQSDQYAFFRHVILLGLLLGFPISLYLIFFAAFRFMLGFVAGPTSSSLISGTVCLAIGVALLAPVREGRAAAAGVRDLSAALRSESWQQRVAALRKITAKRLEIADFPAYLSILKSSRIPEGYWLAKALGASRDPGTYQDLLALVDSHDHHVRSMAFFGLGQRGDIRAIEEIRNRINKSEHWYNQWYAYRALRRLGWRQEKSRPVADPSQDPVADITGVPAY